jgi:hypothetical protein
MLRHSLIRILSVLAAAAVLAPAAAAQQQQRVSITDIQALQEDLRHAGGDLSRLRDTNPSLAGRLRSDLDDLNDEVIYLKVKLRKEGSVTRAEYNDVRNRIEQLRGRVRGEDTRGAGTNTPPPIVDRTHPVEAPRPQADGPIPVGQEMDVRLQMPLSSATAEVEDRFEATTVVDLYSGSRVLIPAGSIMRGIVRSVDRASRTDRRGSLTVSFDQVTIGERTYPLRGTVTELLQSEGVRGEAGRIGAGAGVGAIIGGILGGVRGALLGVLIGGGGTMAATPGKDVELPPGTILRVRLDSPPNIR